MPKDALRSLSVERLPISALKPDPHNPRYHSNRQIKQIARSIETFGFNVPVQIDENGNILVGHGRVLACQTLGWAEVPAIRLKHLTPAQARAFAIADNRLTETYRANFPRAHAFHRKLSNSTDPSEFESVGNIDLLLASPECTNHTWARGSRPRNARNQGTARYVLGFARHFQPRWMVLENVISMRNWAGYDALLDEIRALGYGVRSQIIDAVDFGTPQTRKRLYLLCERGRIPAPVELPLMRSVAPARSILEPRGTFTSRPLNDGSRAEATLQRAQRGIDALGRGKSFLLVYYGSDGSGGWQPLSRPLRTLTTLDRFGLLTWSRDEPMLRMLQPTELQRAMGFDLVPIRREYLLEKGSRRDRIKVLGNAVCPTVMCAIVQSLARQAARDRAAA